jgi:hypothetical protein
MEGPFPACRRRGALRRATAVLTALAVLAVAASPAAAATAAAPSPASSADASVRYPVTGPVVQEALAVGGAYWGSAPCHGDVTPSWGDLPPRTNAEARWGNTEGRFDHPEFNVACEVVLNRDMAWDWPKLCTVVVHELGHLLGHDHAADADDVMYAFYVHPVAPCELTPEPAGETAQPAMRPAGRPTRHTMKRRVGTRRPAVKRSHRAGRSSRLTR